MPKRGTGSDFEPTIIRYNDLRRHAERITDLAQRAPSPKQEWAARLSTNSEGQAWSTEKGPPGGGSGELQNSNPYLPLILDEFLALDPSGGRLRVDIREVQAYFSDGWSTVVLFVPPETSLQGRGTPDQGPFLPEELVEYYEEIREEMPDVSSRKPDEAWFSDDETDFCPSCGSTTWDGAQCQLCGRGATGYR